MVLTEITKGMSNAAEAINGNFQSGAVLESGVNTNGNGNYVKFGDGTLICQTRFHLVYADAGVLEATYSFAHPFSNTGYSITATYGDTTLLKNVTPLAIGFKNESGAYIYCRNVNATFSPGNTVPIEVVAIGRWK